MSATTVSRPIVVGKKSVANYALAVAHRLGEGASSVTLRARGRFIAIAFDACNKALNTGLPLKRGTVRWGQEQGPKGQQVSYVEIELVTGASS
jgi:DNA-binding protein Alba